MVRRWGQSISIGDKPTVIPDPDVLAHTVPVAGGKETSALKPVAGRIATPYKEKTEWIGKGACSVLDARVLYY
jgi:hypothetical protein